MNANQWWVIIWLGVTVLAGGAVVALAPKGERGEAARFFSGWSVGVWAVFGTMILLGWWPR